MSEDYRPRFSFEITEEQRSRALRLLDTHGVRKAVFSVILDDLLDMIEEHGNIVIGCIMDEGVKPREIIPSLTKTEVRVNK